MKELKWIQSLFENFFRINIKLPRNYRNRKGPLEMTSFNSLLTQVSYGRYTGKHPKQPPWPLWAVCSSTLDFIYSFLEKRIMLNYSKVTVVLIPLKCSRFSLNEISTYRLLLRFLICCCSFPELILEEVYKSCVRLQYRNSWAMVFSNCLFRHKHMIFWDIWLNE